MSKPGPPLLVNGLRFSKLASLQILIQLVNAATGILIVRSLDKHEYAWLTIANSITALFSVLVEGATGLGMQSVGSRVWPDKFALSQLVVSALGLRRTLGVLASIVSIPFPLWLLWRNACPLPYALLIILLNVLAFPSLMGSGILSGALKLLGRFRGTLLCDLSGGLGRLLTAVAFLFAGLNAATATLSAAAALWIQHFMLGRTSATLIDPDVAPSPENTSELLGQVRRLWPHALFQYLQGQVSLWLISLHGAIMAVADFGALNRLAFIFSALAAVFYQLIIPALSRTRRISQMKNRVLLASGALLFAIVALVLTGQWLASPILSILGGHYRHLSVEVPWMMAHLGIVTFSMIVWWFNTSRGWVRWAWLNPALTLGVQAAAIIAMRPATVLQIIQFSMLTMAPSVILGLFMTVRGFRLITDDGPCSPSDFDPPPAT